MESIDEVNRPRAVPGKLPAARETLRLAVFVLERDDAEAGVDLLPDGVGGFVDMVDLGECDWDRDVTGELGFE